MYKRPDGKGNKSRHVGAGCKLPHSGANPRGRKDDSKDDLVCVRRKSDWAMGVKFSTGGVALNAVCAYTPQVGCREGEKEEFGRQLDEEIGAIPHEQRIFNGGDVNEHLGKERTVLFGIYDS